MIIAAENELQQKKIVDLDGRPSDCIAMATQQKAPIYVSQEVWDEVDDMSDVLRKMEEEGLKPDPETESEEYAPRSAAKLEVQLYLALVDFSRARGLQRHIGLRGARVHQLIVDQIF